MFPEKKIVASRESSDPYEVFILKAGSEYGPAVSVYYNDRLQDFCTLFYYIVVLRNRDRTVVVNTGLPDDLAPFQEFVQAWHPECRVERRDCEQTAAVLASAGINPAAVTTVLLTPLTIYTTGQLRLFPTARFAVSRKGWIDFWAPEPSTPRLPADIAIARESRLYLVGEALDRVQLLEDEDTVWPGIDVFWTGGHHASSMAIRVVTAKGTVVMGDCFFTYDNLEKNIPIGWAENLREIYVAYDRIRREADIALPLYDPKVMDRFPDGRIA